MSVGGAGDGSRRHEAAEFLRLLAKLSSLPPLQSTHNVDGDTPLSDLLTQAAEEAQPTPVRKNSKKKVRNLV